MKGVRYYRLNVSLAGCLAVMDNAGPRNLACLETVTQTLISEHEAEIEAVCRALSAKVACLPSDCPGSLDEYDEVFDRL